MTDKRPEDFEPKTPTKSDRRASGMMAMVALLVIFGITILVVLVSAQ